MHPKIEQVARTICRHALNRTKPKTKYSEHEIIDLVDKRWRQYVPEARECIDDLKILEYSDLISAWGYPLRNDADWNKMLDHLLA